MRSHVSGDQREWQYHPKVNFISRMTPMVLSTVLAIRRRTNSMRYILLLILLTVEGGILVSAQSNKITFTAPKVYPEGIAFDNKKNVAYVSSVKTGTIG